MPAVCFYFQVHQPHRLRPYSVFESNGSYFDDDTNQRIIRRVAEKCYLPATQLLLDLVNRHQGRFRISFSLTGCVIEQLREHAPAALDLFKALVDTGCCELLGETYHHSLAFIYSRDEFRQQVDLHAQLMHDVFGVTPTVFRNTELIYSNDLAEHLAADGHYVAVLTEGADHVLQDRSPNVLYHPPGRPGLAVLTKNYRLSDDIAFRFSCREWDQWPVTVEKYSRWVCTNHDAGDGGDVCNLFMDYETFGEHQWPVTGIFNFLAALPDQLLDDGCTFVTPSEAAAQFEPNGELDVPHMISWADTERDLTAWLGNAMQSNALHELYKLEAAIKANGDAKLLAAWRNLSASDHFYYMCTKYFADQAVHKYFNPYESPYDSYINYMNVLDSLRTRLDHAAQPALRNSAAPARPT